LVITNVYHTLSKHGETQKYTLNRVSRVQIVYKCTYTCKMSIINSNSDGEVFLDDGFMYLFDAFSSDGLKRFRRCRYKRECKARVHTSITNLIILKRINNHTHDSDAAKVEANIAVRNTYMKLAPRLCAKVFKIIANNCKLIVNNCK